MNIEYKKIKDYLRYIPDFYKEILQTWIKMGGCQTKTLSHFAEIRKQLIWGNKFITKVFIWYQFPIVHFSTNISTYP
jgi:hypothetical protein